MLRTILWVGTGGFIGSVLRYLVQYLMEKSLSSTFPWGTLIANAAGSFIIGIVLAMAARESLMSDEWRIFLAVGVCGGFTTFSAFAFNNFTMISEGAWGSLLFNTAGNLFLGILAVYLGIILVRLLF